MSTLSLCMDAVMMRVALGVSLCQPHPCHQCWTEVHHLGLHGLSCRMSQGRHSRHAAVNELIKTALALAKVPSHLEPWGTLCVNGKRPDGATVMPWKCGLALIWDAACPDTYIYSFTSGPCYQGGWCSCERSRAAKDRKVCPPQGYPPLVPFAIETLGVFGPEALSLLEDLGRRIRAETGEPRFF